ncbi:MAG: hypothetical protein RL685_6287 [Pseudomonadota bacterium]|jgi:hypothetical protein
MAQMIRAAQVESGDSFLSFDVVLTEPGSGPAIDCTEGVLTVDVEMSKPGSQTYETVSTQNIRVRCDGSVGPDIALVIDNSGSEAGKLTEVREAAARLIEHVEGANGRVSLVRVSTAPSVLGPLTNDMAAARTALGDLHVSNGWTALYDGIRVGNETLGGAVLAEDAQNAATQVDFCAVDPQRAILVFTDGYENNSSDEHASENYPGDGINTTLEDLTRLQARGVTTPIYSIGLGDEVDHDALRGLAESSGGKHHRTESTGAVTELFQHIASYSGPRFKVCASLPSTGCGVHDVKLSYRWDGAGRTINGSRSSTLNVACPTPVAQGKSATVLLTLSNPGIDARSARELVKRTTTWVSPVADPRVLVVLDDNHHDEYAGDAAYVSAALDRAAIANDLVQEPEHGIDVSMLDGYDVVWFSNPGYPMDDQASFETLQAAIGRGMGVVLQGDDISWSWGQAFDMSPLTHLTFEDNGTDACGKHTDNNNGDGAFQVDFVPSHPMLGSVGGSSFLYGDDIDLTSPKNQGEQILAWGNVVSRDRGTSACSNQVPVVVAYDPAAQ